MGRLPGSQGPHVTTRVHKREAFQMWSENEADHQRRVSKREHGHAEDGSGRTRAEGATPALWL
jgi:hypothetical protein